MAALKPWYKIDGLTPREDLREGKPLDASEFAVHLDKVRDETAPPDYKEPARFFDRTYLTKYLTDLAAQVVRRLSGEKTETSAVFNLATQFGGGKTHALTLLYHLAKQGAAANNWTGVQKILQKAGLSSIPEAAVAVFVGTEFDSIQGRGGDDGTPLRKTPWGEIAYQLGGAEALAVLAEHEAQFIEPKGDVIRKFLPKEIRLAVAEPSLDIGNVETVLETLSTHCYYLSIEKNKYRFSLSPNLNKILADRRANVQASRITNRVTVEIQKVFVPGQGIQPIYFPENSSAVPNRAVLTLAILAPEYSMQDSETVKFVESMTREYGTSDRTFKSAIVWAIADSDTQLREETRKLLAWEDIRDEERERLDDSQKRQLDENLKKAERDLKESVWRSYKNIALLGKDNKIRTVDLGMVTSSMARNMVELIVNRLRQDGDVEDSVSPRFIVRNWSPAFTEWSTKAVRDAFFASPLFPRLLNGDGVKEAIARGVRDGILAYVGKTGDAKYEPFQYQCTISAADVEISDDVFIITQETASAYKKAESESLADTQNPSPQTINGDTANNPATTVSVTATTTNVVKAKTTPYVTDTATEPTEIITPPPSARVLKWSGAITPQKWMNFYTRVLSKFAANKHLKLTLKVSVSVEGDVSTQKIEETKVALQELGLGGDIETDIH